LERFKGKANQVNLLAGERRNAHFIDKEGKKDLWESWFWERKMFPKQR